MPLWGGFSVEIVDEDASFVSSSASLSRISLSSSRISVGSSSTFSRNNNNNDVVTPARDVRVQQRPQRAGGQLRRQSTFHRLSRWVSKRTSRQWTDSVTEKPAPENANAKAVVANVTKEATVLRAPTVIREEGNDANLPSSPKTLGASYATFRDRVFTATVAVTEQQQEGRGSSSSSTDNPSPQSPSSEPIGLVARDRLFIRSPPQSIVNLQPKQLHPPYHHKKPKEHGPSWRQITTTPVPILETESSYRVPSSSSATTTTTAAAATTTQSQSPPLKISPTAPEAHSLRAAAATRPTVSAESNNDKNYNISKNLPFADRIRAATQSAAGSPGPRPGLPVSSPPCATTAPPRQVGTNTQPQPSSTSPLRRRQSLWQPLKSKLSVLRLKD